MPRCRIRRGPRAFASNFPVDGMHGSLDQLWATYTTVAAGLSALIVDNLFAATAERVYRC
jgi:L-fuconolactonase